MRVLLNIVKRDVSAFFDPVNRMHLNRVNPVGFARELSPSLKRAIIAGTVIDVDNSFGVEISEKVKEYNEKVLSFFNITRKAKEVIKKEAVEVKEIKEEAAIAEEVIETVEEAKEEVQKPKRKTTRKQVSE